MEPYIYSARVDRIYDGDTITCTINCGFGVHLLKQKIRLYGLNSPEVRGKEREQGLVARDKLREKIQGETVMLKTLKDKKGKYGRYLGILYLDGENINDWLIENGLAVKAEY